MGRFCNWPQKMQLQSVANLDVNPPAPPDSFLRLVIQQETSAPFLLPLFLQPQTFGIFGGCHSIDISVVSSPFMESLQLS